MAPSRHLKLSLAGVYEPFSLGFIVVPRHFVNSTLWQHRQNWS